MPRRSTRSTRSRTATPVAWRRSGSAAAVAVLLGLVFVVPVAAIDVSPDGADPTVGPLPADEPAVARSVVSCELPSREGCQLLFEELLGLPFAWHRVGYELRLMVSPPAEITERAVTGRPRAATLPEVREIHLYFPEMAGVTPGTALGGDAVASVPDDLDRVLAHEMGHTFHQTCDELAMLRGWREERGIPHEVPKRGHGHDGRRYASVAEDLAEAAVVWLLDGRYESRSTVASVELTSELLDSLAGSYFRVCPS